MEQTNPNNKRTAPRRRTRLIPLISILILLIGGCLLTADFTIRWTQKHVQTFAAEIGQAATALETARQKPGTAILDAQQHIGAARAELETLRPVAEPVVFVAGYLTNAPLIGQNAEQVVALWLFADATTHLGEELLAAARTGLVQLEGEGTAGLLATVPTLQGHIQTAQQNLTQAQAARSQLADIPPWLPPSLRAKLDQAFAQWDAASPRLEKMLSGTNLLLSLTTVLLGDDRPQTYLLLLQSSDELRATGGFITSIGQLQIEEGQIVEITFQEVKEGEKRIKWSWAQGYAERPNPPPPPMAQYMGLGQWVLRDANWWADFPATARQAIELWKDAPNTPTDGVIALTDQGIELLLQATGPVKTEDGRTVNADNLKRVMVDELYGENANAETQAAFFTELGLALFDLSQQLPPDRLLRVAEYLPLAFKRGDILITNFEPEKALVLHELGVDGALQGAEDDYFYLVEHNVSYNKLSPFIRQDLTYEVELDPNGWPSQSSLLVIERNSYTPGAGLSGYPDNYYAGGRWNPTTLQVERWEGYYGGYTRLYLPRQSQILKAIGFVDNAAIGQESKRTVAGGYVGVMPGQQQELRFQWVPVGQPSTPGQYRLYVQKQPGAPEHTLKIMAHLPPGYQAADISPTPVVTGDNTITWQTGLDQDRAFSLQLERTGEPLPPRPTEAAAVAGPTEAPPPRPTPRPVAPAPPPPPGRAPQPVWLSIPAIEVAAPIIPVGIEEPTGIMASPPEADLIAWYKFGPRPGEASNAVLSGHINWMGQRGVFARLHELEPGDLIEVQSGPESGFRYVVDSLEVYPADTAPVTEIFGATADPILTLITCVGPYDEQRQEYRDRLVVRARATE